MTPTLEELKKEFEDRTGSWEHLVDEIDNSHGVYTNWSEVWSWFEQKYSLSYQSGVKEERKRMAEQVPITKQERESLSTKQEEV
jgi:hypothetical protein